MEFQRAIKPALDELAVSFPIVCITGPRQSGKTTCKEEKWHLINYKDIDRIVEISGVKT